MRRQMAVINVVLLVAAVSLAVKLRGDWRRANQRYAALATTARPAVPLAAPPGGKVTGAIQRERFSLAGAADLEVIAQRNLFSPDRNNDLPKEIAQRRPAPPEPLVIGTLNVGSGKIALMSESAATAGTMSRQVREGETFGGYQVVSIGDSVVVVEYEGQRKKVEVYTAAQQVPAPPSVAAADRPAAPQIVSTASSAPPPATSQPAPVTTTGSTGAGPGPLAPGTNIRLGTKDTLPAGTVIDNYRKVVRPTPFGNQVWWEPIKPEERKP